MVSIRAPSMVSIKHMPAVKRTGKIKMSHIDVPFAACMDEMPRRAISEEVSKPKPNNTPNGYIFQGLTADKFLDLFLVWYRSHLSISLNIFFNIIKRQPPPSTFHA